MIYQFIFNSVQVTIDTVNRTITHSEKSLTGVTRKYRVGDYRQDPESKSIVVTNYTWLEDVNGNIIAVDALKKPIVRAYNRTHKTSQGQIIFDFFAGLVSDLSLLELTILATTNNQLENMKDVFLESVPCFNPYNNWSFFYPTQLLNNGVDIQKVDESALDANNGMIVLNVGNKLAGYNYEYSIDNGSSWSVNGTFNNLVPNTYTVTAKNTIHNIPATPKQITITKYSAE
jgi:hypothetical protein